MAEPVTVVGGGPARNRRAFVLAGAAAVLLLGVVVLPGLLFSDGGSSDDALPATPTPGVTTTTVASGPAAAETFEPFTSKNPFEPLVEMGSPAGVEEDVSTTSTIPPLDEGTFFPDDGSFVFPEDQPAGDGSSATTTTAPPPGPPPRQPDRVSLLEVFSDAGGQVVASVRVNDVTHQVAEGDEYATSYRVLSLDIEDRCGEFLFGDDRFALCEGEETLK